MLRQRNKSKGQALVEFALIITVLLMLMFLIVESARILQGWVTVQNAARNGARYAITGANMTNCPTASSPKWASKCSDLRVASIYTTTHRGLSGLPLNEDGASNAYRDINGNPPDPNSYDIQVYGGSITDQGPQLLFDFGGMPGQPVVVRAVYNVPIITPFFRPIIESVPVFGQVTMNNENFGSLGNPTQGLGLPPDLGGPIPTVGATPTPTPSPTPTETNTPGATASPTLTPSNTPTATPTYCGANFEKTPVDGETFAWVSGEPGATITILDQTTGQTLGTDTFLLAPDPNRLCDGFADFNVTPLIAAFQAGHVVLAIPSQGQPDTAIVLQGTPTPTPSPTSSPAPSSTPTVSPTPSLTPTPVNPYITLIPNCSIGSSAQFQVLGFNWPTNEAIALFWNGAPQSNIPAGHSGFFAQTWQKSNLTVGSPTNPNIYVVSAQSNSASDTANFEVPCSNVTPTVIATSTSTPSPEDLIIVGPPQLVSTRPLVAYQPIEVSLLISNTGDVDVSNQFFVDVYFDPVGPVSPTIGITQSVGYMGVSSLPGRSSRVITITAPLGFANLPDPHLAYGMVDSLNGVAEAIEYNNVSAPLTVGNVTPAATPTPSPTPQTGSENISGIVWIRIGNWVPQNRATVTLINELNGQQVNSTVTDRNGFFQFFAPPGTYTVRSCALIDNIQLSGLRTGITAPNSLADIYLLPGACP